MSTDAFFAWFTVWLAAGLFAMSVAIALAHFKRRTWVLWAVLCLFIPPLLIWLVLLPRRSGPAPYEKESDSWFDQHGEEKNGTLS